MNKLLQTLTFSKASPFADFTSKLSAKWRLSTTETSPDQPSATDADTELMEIFARLVSFPTVTSNRQANNDALDYIETFLSVRGMHTKRLAWNGVETLIATTRKTKRPTVLLAGHVDVVPGDEELFELREKDGKLFGRGVMDMKFAIATYMQLIDDLKCNLHEYDLGIMINTDEEVGGFDGAQHIADEKLLVPKVLVAPDGGSDWALEKYAKGICWVSITAEGKNAHASRPWEGVNAMHKLLDVIAEVQKLFPKVPDPDSNTVNVGVISGGKTPNQIAASASTTIDMRFVNLKEDHRIRKQIVEICQKAGVDFNMDVYSPPFENDPKDPYISTFAKAIEHTIGRHAGFTKSNALNDARFFGPKGIPCVIFYPPGGDHHGPEEFIYKEGLFQTLEILHTYVEEQAKKSD